jgi:dienelactone hydrolase
MKKYHLLLLVLLIKTLAFSQNPSVVPDNVPTAYLDYLYTDLDIIKTTEIYKTNVPKFSIPVNINNPKQNLSLDIYSTPVNSACIGLRPLIVFTPGGGGNRMVYDDIARDLARRGYIVATISVRSSDPVWSGFYALAQISNPNLKKKVNPLSVYTYCMDVHNAIKYLTIQRASTYGIDPNYVIVGGGSLGGGTAMQAAFMDKAEADAEFGQSVNPGLGVNVDVYDPYFNDFDATLQTTKIKGVIAFSGSVYNTTIIKPTERIPVFMFHGNKDPAVPYKDNYLFYNTSDVFLYGSTSIATTIQNNGNSYCLITGKEMGHTTNTYCGNSDGAFPTGYPMNWYPDMLAFLKNSVLCGNLNQSSKNIDCISNNFCDVTTNSATCRVVDGNAAAISNTIGNSSPIVLPSLPITACQSSIYNQHCHAFSFDGGDYIRVNSSSSFAGVSTIIDFWYKKTGTIPSNKINIFYTAGNDININNSKITTGFIGENSLWLYIKDPVGGSSNNYTFSIPTIDVNWHHYAIVYYGNKFDFYVDGIRQVNQTVPFTIDASNNNHYFGGAPYSMGTASLPYTKIIGQIDNIRYWSDLPDAFSTFVILNYIINTNSYNICPSSSYLTGYWKLNLDGQTVKDETNFHNDGIKGISVGVDAADPTYVSNCNTSVRMANPKNSNTNDSTKNTILENKAIEIINEKEILNIFPNPTNSKPNVLFVSNSDGVGVLEIINENGLSILNTKISLKVGVNILTSYLPKLSSGFYIFKVQSTIDSFTQKIIITK